MPSSLPTLIEPVLSCVEALRPTTILDIGIGHGKYAMLIKEYCPWVTLIEGVEAWDVYVTDVQRLLYDTIHLVDIRQWEMPFEYDMFLLIDLIEHLEKGEGYDLLRGLKGHLVVTTPDGFMSQGDVGGNPFEVHRSAWTMDDFAEFNVKRRWWMRNEIMVHIDSR